jgi:hypothetical protein
MSYIKHKLKRPTAYLLLILQYTTGDSDSKHDTPYRYWDSDNDSISISDSDTANDIEIK